MCGAAARHVGRACAGDSDFGQCGGEYRIRLQPRGPESAAAATQAGARRHCDEGGRRDIAPGGERGAQVGRADRDQQAVADDVRVQGRCAVEQLARLDRQARPHHAIGHVPDPAEGS